GRHRAEGHRDRQRADGRGQERDHARDPLHQRPERRFAGHRRTRDGVRGRVRALDPRRGGREDPDRGPGHRLHQGTFGKV
ncbi:MAG: Acyl carrier protein, partial [uncultured Phycisphaerae bacterium]